MTDNEKRAHDLAVALCMETAHAKSSSLISAGETNITIDYFEEYMSAYTKALEAFNKRFPPEK